MCRLFFFFFSSRRRHTRSLRDWSSDVCSSDLARLRAASERVFIEHEPNASSGGQTTHIEIGDFLMHGGHGPCCGLSEHWSRSPLGPERTGGAAALMGGQPGKPSPPGNPTTPRE